MPTTCESCGRVEEDVIEVIRLYVTPETWETPEQVAEGAPELWCFVCRTHYPHRVPGDTDTDTDAGTGTGT